MTDPISVEAIRAAVEVICPPMDGSPGATSLGIHRFVADQLEGLLPGYSDLVASLLDAYASEARAGSSFAGLSTRERHRVLRAMSIDESQDVQESLTALLLFTLSALCSEWTGTGSPGEFRPPSFWKEMGYAGPSVGHPRFRR